MTTLIPLILIHRVSLNKSAKKHRFSPKGSSLVELIIVTVLFAIFVPISLGIYIGGRKITGQSYIQHAAALALAETGDILEYMRNENYSLLENGSFYLIRNPGNNSWLIKSDLPDRDTFERYISVSDALRHTDTKNLYMLGDTGDSYADPDTKKIEIQILWAPDYIPMDLISRTFYVSNWQNAFTFPSS